MNIAKNMITSLVLRFLHRLIQPKIYNIGTLKLYICKDVFTPLYTITPEFLAENLDLNPNWEILEIGTGTGYIAIKIARKVRRVVASDLNPYAVKCAKFNVKLNQLDNKITVIQSDLFNTIEKHYFDSVIFNPPYLKGAPKSELECAWLNASPELLMLKFIHGVSNYLKPGGLVQIGYSTLGPVDTILRLFVSYGFKLREKIEKKTLWERIFVFKFEKVTDP